MLHADNALLHEIIRTAHDPDPVRAARYRPFGYPTSACPWTPRRRRPSRYPARRA